MSELYTLPLISDSALEGYYRFEVNYNDSSGKDRNLSAAVGTDWYFTSGKYNAGSLLKYQHYVYINNSMGINGGNITLGLWFLNIDTSISTDDKGIICQNNITSKTRYYISRKTVSSTDYLVFTRDGIGGGGTPGSVYYPWNTLLNTPSFKLIVLTYDGTYIRGYVDGSMVEAPAAASGNGLGYAGAVTGFGVGISQGWTGWNNIYTDNAVHDDAFIFSRCLSDEEIGTIYREKKTYLVSKKDRLNMRGYSVGR